MHTKQKQSKRVETGTWWGRRAGGRSVKFVAMFLKKRDLHSGVMHCRMPYSVSFHRNKLIYQLFGRTFLLDFKG